MNIVVIIAFLGNLIFFILGILIVLTISMASPTKIEPNNRSEIFFSNNVKNVTIAPANVIGMPLKYFKD